MYSIISNNTILENLVVIVFFVFQAEVGIRDLIVTGVQTCALPIWTSGPWQVEVRGDELADIRYAGRPVLRSVRGVARDQDWETVPVAVREVVETDDGLD